MASGSKASVCRAEFSGCHSRVSCHGDGNSGWTGPTTRVLREQPFPQELVSLCRRMSTGAANKQAGARLGGQELPCISTALHVSLRGLSDGGSKATVPHVTNIQAYTMGDRAGHQLCEVTDGNETHVATPFAGHASVKSLCCSPATNRRPCVNYASINGKK